MKSAWQIQEVKAPREPFFDLEGVHERIYSLRLLLTNGAWPLRLAPTITYYSSHIVLTELYENEYEYIYHSARPRMSFLI